VIAIYQSFDTADEPLTLGVGSNAIWRRLWQTLGDPAYGHLPEFTTNAKRREKREEIVKYIQDILKKKSRAEWLETFAAARVPAGPINRVDDVAHDAGLQDRGLFFVLQDGHRTIPQIGLGIHFDGEYVVPRSGPPLLGQHTEEVLSALPAPSA
jgi:crotonobetainyl-CoA:carnitine CoA-transferase CaiB-like acyl-CoA transferase